MDQELLTTLRMMSHQLMSTGGLGQAQDFLTISALIEKMVVFQKEEL